MQLSYGVPVYAADGEKLGHIKEFVIDPRYRIVTHIVLQQGLFFSHDRLIAAENVDNADQNGAYLSVTTQVLDQATQPFDHQQYVELKDEDFIARYGVGGAVWKRPEHELGGAGLNTIVPPGIGPVPPEPDVSIPSDEVGLAHGSRVVSEEGTQLGTLKECRTNEKEQITHLVIYEGQLFKEAKKIPVEWIRKIEENEITLGVPLSVVEQI